VRPRSVRDIIDGPSKFDPGRSVGTGRAESTEAALRAYLRGAQNEAMRGVVMGWGVVVPDVPFRVTSPDTPKEATYDADDGAQPFWAFIERLAGFHAPHTSPKTHKALPRAEVSRLAHAISSSFSLVPSLRAVVDRTDGEAVRLSEQQSHILDGLVGSPRVIVRGGAGTGKTLIACREAVRVAESGLDTLNVRFGKRLAESLRPELEARGVRLGG
jgi:hypothetical protein